MALIKRWSHFHINSKNVKRNVFILKRPKPIIQVNTVDKTSHNLVHVLQLVQ